MKARRTLDDLNYGGEARAIDILRLALHYIIRGGWRPATPSPAGALVERIGLSDRPTSIEAACGRARRELHAVWMRGIEASEAVRDAIGAGAHDIGAIARWERAEGRCGDDAIGALKRAIVRLAQQHPGSLIDVTV